MSGGRPLEGAVTIQGSKNGALPVLAGALLQKGVTVLYNCPRIADVDCMLQILEHLGCKIQWQDNTLVIDAACAQGVQVPEKLGGKMRSSVILLGSLLGRYGKAVLPYPGGCTIGKRPIDLHKKALAMMGAVFEDQENAIAVNVPRGLVGQKICLPFPSVGATENVILSAVTAQGETILQGAAREPEIEELCRFLKGKGAVIFGEGSDQIVIRGVKELHDSSYTLAADRIVAGTYLLGAALTRGRVFLEKAPYGQMDAMLAVLGKMGAVIRSSPKGIDMDGRGAVKPLGFLLKTEPYPGFPTDLQSPLMAALAVAQGESVIEECIFEARFHVVRQFRRMGADISIEEHKARIRGVSHLCGTYVKAQELRGGAALVLAALGAQGTTMIQDDGYIGRGYENLARDLRHLNASIRTDTYGG